MKTKNEKRNPEPAVLEDARCRRLISQAMLGLSSDFIADKQNFSKSQVSYRLRKFGIRLSEFRRGNWLTRIMLSKLEQDDSVATKIEWEIRHRMKQMEKEREEELELA